LYIACQNVHIEVVKNLVEHGADINKEDNDGATPLYIACFNEQVVKYLVEHEADINKEADGGFTPLYIACQNGHIEV